jgi:hypothetical protein
MDSAASAQIVSPARGLHWLIELDFTTGTLYITTAPISQTIDGNTYIGMGGGVTVGDVGESEDASAAKLPLSFPVVNQAMLAACTGSVEIYRGRRVRLYAQVFDEAFRRVGAKVARWSGYMDKVQVPRKRTQGGGVTGGRIELVCSRAGMARARNVQGLRLSDAQQKQRFPGDKGFEYIQTLIEQPTQWLSKRFQAVEG